MSVTSPPKQTKTCSQRRVKMAHFHIWFAASDLELLARSNKPTSNICKLF